MRIGELAAAAGVTTRAVRHYHHRGLLPEPARRSNGYRVYGLRDLIVLARIRRLTELGLSLDEVADALADQEGRDLREILQDLDNHLARQQERLTERRTRLAALIARAEDGWLDPDDVVAPDLLAVLDNVAPSPLADRERELLALLDTHPDRDRIVAAMGPPDPAHSQNLNHRLAALADAPPDDPRIPTLAADLADTVPPELRTMIDGSVDPFGEAVLDSLTPAQAEVIRQALHLMSPP